MIVRVAVVTLVALSLAGTAAAARDGCHEVGGTFTAVTLPPGGSCPSPIFCTLGVLTGDLAGTYFFSVAGFGPGGELLAASTITLENGAAIQGSDTSVLHPDGTFTTTVSVVGGNRQYAHAAGQIVADGAFTAEGTAGTYAGEICLGRHASD
jgi:hypothetical protein